MKRNLFSVVFLAALALAAVSCNREEPDGPDGLKALYLEQPSTVQASLDNESDTKTDFQMNAAGTFGQILWTSGDSFPSTMDRSIILPFIQPRRPDRPPQPSRPLHPFRLRWTTVTAFILHSHIPSRLS